MKEKIYDNQIAPLMEQIIEICKENNISFHATAHFDDKFCTTHLNDNSNAAMRILYYAAMTKGNVDQLIMTLIKDAKQYGHSSMYMERLCF